MSGLGEAALALTFLTRLPAPSPRDLGTGALGRSIVWFPVVGALVGGVLGGTRLLADLALPPGPSTAVALIAAILVTGGLHEDGLADTADGLGAHTSRERKLEIMRDPRVGAYGALALVSSFVLTWALLSDLDGVACLQVGVVGHSLARWAMPVAATVFPPARADGAGALMTVGRVRLGIATATVGAITLATAGPVPGVFAMAAALVTTLAVGACATRVVGGITGDTHGATGKAVELVAFIVVVAVWR